MTSTSTPSGTGTARGISPSILLDQVRNTVPFLFEAGGTHWDTTPYLRTLRSAMHEPHRELSHLEYFRLCVSAHFGTVSSFVPTDVDNQIRFRLWNPALPTETFEAMADLVLEAHEWDLTSISERYVRSPATGRVLSGMHGEWFSIAAAAYAALRNRSPKKAEQVRDRIRAEMRQESEIFCELRSARDGVGLLKAATSIAHNLGDLDRVMDQWNLPADDALRVECYKAGHEEPAPGCPAEFLSVRRTLSEAGNLNKRQLGFTSLADENHRHFALRAAKCLRRSRDFLLPIAPFYDDWGARVGRHPALSPEEVAEVVECLIDGWERLKPVQKTQTYPRALAGIESTFPGGLQALCRYLPSRVAKTLRTGALRGFCSTPRRKFEDQLSTLALAGTR